MSQNLKQKLNENRDMYSEIFKRALVTLFVVMVYRLGHYIAVPGVDLGITSSAVETLQGMQFLNKFFWLAYLNKLFRYAKI